MNDAHPELIPFIDLTSLNETDTQEKIIALCKEAVTPIGSVAAVCIYPAFIKSAKQALVGTRIKIATVANFPSGDFPLPDCLEDIKSAIQAGADEVDVVMPYRNYLNGNTRDVLEFLQACRGICGPSVIYKVILETGELVNVDVIAGAAEIAIESGADFIKTSTGKTDTGATHHAVEAILDAIKNFPQKKVGLKVSGGIPKVEQAMEYFYLIADKMGKEWMSPKTLRFGASQLLKDILHKAKR